MAKRLIPLLIAASGILSADIARAYDFSGPGASNIVTQKANNTSPDLLVNQIWFRLVNDAFAVLAGLAGLMIIVAGIQYITAGGNQDQAKKARQAIINSTLGIIAIVSAYAIVATLTGTASWVVSKLQ